MNREASAVDISPEAVADMVNSMHDFQMTAKEGSWEAATAADAMQMFQALRLQLTARAWQPIATAPQDGTEFQAWLVNRYVPGGFWIARCRYNEHGAFEIWTRCDYDQHDWEVSHESSATHWMPHPEAPK